MFHKLTALLLGLLVLFTTSAVSGQTPAPPAGQPPAAPGLRKLTGEDEKRANDLDEQIDKSVKADRWDEAIGQAEELLALRTRVQGAEHFEAVDAKEVLKNLRRVAPRPHEDRVAYRAVKTMNEQAVALFVQGKYAAAQPLFEKALEVFQRLLSDDHAGTAACYSWLAANLVNQGKYAQAQPVSEKALEILRRLLGDDHPDTAKGYNGLAINLRAQGKYAQAQPLFEKALAINRRLLGDDHPDIAKGYNGQATNLKAQGKYVQAQPLYEKALELHRRLLGDDHADTAVGYNNLAANLNDQGKYAAAQPLYEKALEIYRRRLSDNHPFTANSYNNLAMNLTAQGKYAAAQPLFEKALEIRCRLLSDEHPSTANSYTNVAYNLNAQGRYVEARDRWLSAVKSLDAARLRVAFTGLDRAGTTPPGRTALAAVLARLGQPAEAWQPLEEDLGRGLLDELAARQDRRLAPGERARLRELTDELERLNKLVETTPKGLDQAERAGRFEELKRQRELASIAVGEFQTKLAEQHGALTGQVARLNDVQAALPADAALVAWVDIPPPGPNAADPDGEHWGVVVRSRGIPAWIAIAGTGPNGLWTKDDNELASRARTELRLRPGAGSADLRPLVEKLRAQRLEPLARALGALTAGLPRARTLIVLPSRAMAGIPVETLLAPSDTRTVSYAPSATVFNYLREQPRPGRHAGLLALGDPVYERPNAAREPRPLPEQRKLQQVFAAARSGDEDFAPLPGTRYEVEALASLFKSDDRPTMALFGADASEPELDRLAASGELGRFGFIHLAAHGVIDEAVPQRSAVILTQTGLPDPLEQVLHQKPVFDGRLSAREIQHGWDLRAELVTLSACETALGRDVGGEGFVGFTQALLMAGARSVCLSLWKVDDTATALLMQRFYANVLGRRTGLSQPLPKAQALAEAKTWLRGLTRGEVAKLAASLSGGEARSKGVKTRDEAASGLDVPAGPGNDHPYAHPYYWAAFVLVGDPD